MLNVVGLCLSHSTKCVGNEYVAKIVVYVHRVSHGYHGFESKNDVVPTLFTPTPFSLTRVIMGGVRRERGGGGGKK